MAMSDTARMFLATKGNLFPSDKLGYIKDKLETMDEDKIILLSSMEYHNPTTLLIISIFLGGWGVDSC